MVFLGYLLIISFIALISFTKNFLSISILNFIPLVNVNLVGKIFIPKLIMSYIDFYLLFHLIFYHNLCFYKTSLFACAPGSPSCFYPTIHQTATEAHKEAFEKLNSATKPTGSREVNTEKWNDAGGNQ